MVEGRGSAIRIRSCKVVRAKEKRSFPSLSECAKLRCSRNPANADRLPLETRVLLMYMIPRLSANLECRRANICPESALDRNLALSVAGRIGPWGGLVPEVWLY